MKVYLVMRGNDQGADYLCDIFDTYEKALNEAKQLCKECDIEYKEGWFNIYDVEVREVL